MYLLTSSVILVNLIVCYAVDNQRSPDKCVVLKDKFGLVVSNFTYCAINNSHPIRFCQECVLNYIDVLSSFNNLSHVRLSSTLAWHKTRRVVNVNTAVVVWCKSYTTFIPMPRHIDIQTRYRVLQCLEDGYSIQTVSERLYFNIQMTFMTDKHQKFKNTPNTLKSMSHAVNLSVSSMDINKTACYDPNTAFDRLEIIGTMYENVQNLWSRAKCNECFVVNNGSITPEPANITIQFYKLYKNVVSCIDGKSLQNDTEICRKCLNLYMELSDYYNSISDINEEIANCMDIVDLMNGTRTFWSDNCCRYRHHKEYVFIISTCLMLIVTVSFYSLAKLLIDKKLPVVFSQSRFAESLNHTRKR